MTPDHKIADKTHKKAAILLSLDVSDGYNTPISRKIEANENI